jgi:hypothetical protein
VACLSKYKGASAPHAIQISVSRTPAQRARWLPAPRPLALSCALAPRPPWCTEGEGLGENARRALLAPVSAPQVLLDSGAGGAGLDNWAGACEYIPAPSLPVYIAGTPP